MQKDKKLNSFWLRLEQTANWIESRLQIETLSEMVKAFVSPELKNMHMHIHL